MSKEAYDDYIRYQRDTEANSQHYTTLDSSGNRKKVPSSALRVGDLVIINKNQRVPADCLLLRTSESSGACFIRTDQLDGETDWKLRVAIATSQELVNDKLLVEANASIYGTHAHTYSL